MKKILFLAILLPFVITSAMPKETIKEEILPKEEIQKEDRKEINNTFIPKETSSVFYEDHEVLPEGHYIKEEKEETEEIYYNDQCVFSEEYCVW